MIMRVLIRLRAQKDCAYDMKYHSKMQGFFYNLLKESGFAGIHNKKGCKFFCFSNIYPIDDMKKGDSRNLIFSSPDERLVRSLCSTLDQLKQKNAPVNIGETLFSISSVSLLKPHLSDGACIISATPIVIRIPERNYSLYAIPEEDRKKSYVYWRPSIDFSAFVKQSNENLIKKYNEFYKTSLEQFPVFSQYHYRKPVVSHIIEDGKDYPVIGSLWEFSFPYISKEQKNILEFGIDCGFGERNSLGFGFMNLIKNNSQTLKDKIQK